MSNVDSIAEAVFAGCSANVGPLIGTELETGQVSIETSSEIPEGDLAVLPIACEIDEELVETLTLSSPLSEIATLGRRMLGADDPDKESDLSPEDLDAIGEVLNLMSGAVDPVVREQISGNIRSRPLPWWRTPEPGDTRFEEGEFLLAKSSVAIPGAAPAAARLRRKPLRYQTK